MVRTGLLCVLLAAAGCDSGGGESVPTVTIRGVAMPGGQATESIVVAFDSEGTTYWRDRSSPDGRYALEVPATLAYVHIAAIDPNDPNRMAVVRAPVPATREATAPLAEGDVAARRDALDEADCVIDPDSTAEWQARFAGGGLDSPAPLTPGQQAMAMALKARAGAVGLCDGRYDPAAEYEPLPVVTPVGEERRAMLDAAVANTSGDLADRLRAGQQVATGLVWSSNQESGIARGLGYGAFVFTTMARADVNHVTGFSGAGFYESAIREPVITREALADAAAVILGHGWGNCREKGMLGAYAATQVTGPDAFETIAILSVSREGSADSHALAVACENETNFNRWAQAYAEVGFAEPVSPPFDVEEGNCQIIDPWDGTTAPMGVNTGRWRRIVDVVYVDREPAPWMPSSRFANDACAAPACEVPENLPPVRPEDPVQRLPVPGPPVTITVCSWGNGDDGAGPGNGQSCTYNNAAFLGCDLQGGSRIRVTGSPSHPVFVLEDVLGTPYDQFRFQNNDFDGTRYAIDATGPAGLPQVIEHGDRAPLGGRIVPHIGPGADGLRPGPVYRLGWLHSELGIGQPYSLSFILGSVGDVQDACFGN